MSTVVRKKTFFQYDPAADHWYRPSRPLVLAVNTALAADLPLLVTGEPGTGKTTLAGSIAEIRGLELFTFHTKSDHQARDCLYQFDNLERLYDVQAEDPRAKKPKNYVKLNALGKAIAPIENERGEETERDARTVVLIDEIDKAPRDFPNDLLNVAEMLRFEVRETGRTYEAAKAARPILVITSNTEKALPDAFLRRCVYHHIEFPDAKQLREIVDAQLVRWKIDTTAVEAGLIDAVVRKFQAVRELADLEKPPATAELLAWLRVLLAAGVEAKALAGAPWEDVFPGALVKTQADLERLVLRT